MRSIGHRQQSASAPDAALSSPAVSMGDRISAFPPRCLCTVCSWVLPSCLPLWILGQSLTSDVAGRLPEGMADPTPLCTTGLCGHWFLICCPPQLLVSHLLSPRRGLCADSCWWKSGAYGVLLRSFSMFPFHRGIMTPHLCWISSTWWIFQSRSPCFRSKEEFWLHICVEYPQLGGFSKFSGAPNFLENE